MLIDLRHPDRPRVLGVYLAETDDGPALFDCGPASTVPALKKGLAAHGLRLQDVRHLCLTHVHLDHAGASGVLVREHPARMTHASTADAPFAPPGNLVRLSVGIESADDLVADLDAALVRRAAAV